MANGTYPSYKARALSDTLIHDALCCYPASIRQDRRANQVLRGDGTALELLLAPRMQALIETILAACMPEAPRVLPEYRTPGIGRPDLAFRREGQPARSFIELKQPETNLDPRRLRGHDRDQFQRFRELPLWGFCNFHTIHLYRNGELVEQAIILPAAALQADTGDITANRLIRRHDTAPFMTILETLALAPVRPPRDAREVAESLARAARLVRQIVTDQCRLGPPDGLAAARDAFRETLFAHAAVAGYDDSDENVTFGNAFAQTLAFGLLLAREAGARDIDRHAYLLLSDGTYPLLRVTLRILTQDEILDVLGAAFDVIQDVVNAIDTSLLVQRQGHDPILYFYEDFLQIFDPEARRRHGVFFTPVAVVRYMIAATDQALCGTLETHGLLDPNVFLLDPACGTGTFLIAAASAGAERARQLYGEGAVAQEISALARRLHGFEFLIGPYTVAHYRMLREVARYNGVPVGRLPIFLADTLARSSADRLVVTRLGFMEAPIVAERRLADRLKQDTPILAIVGNPPYRRLAVGEDRTVFSGWAEPLWDDLKQAVRDAGWANELNTFPELSVAFWRWCIWKLFESDGAPGRGVVCLITNRTFLAGHPYAGLRQSLRRHFDRIDIIDLRGDSRGARPAGIESDENVFQVQVGVCIVLAVATGVARAPDEQAVVRYADMWRHARFSSHEKLALLDSVISNNDEIRFSTIERTGLEDFLPSPFSDIDAPSLADVFAFVKSGSKSQRDDLVYGFSRESVFAKLTLFVGLRPEEAWTQYYPGSDTAEAQLALGVSTGSLSAHSKRLRGVFEAARSEQPTSIGIERRIYRPLDSRFMYASPRFVSRHGPELRAAWGPANVCIYAMPSGTGAGPAVWVHAHLPDYHALSGRGGYAFPLWDRRLGPGTHNFDPVLLRGLTMAYGQTVPPEDAFDAIAALLSATSYTLRFATDLEESFAHIPLPAAPEVFAEAVRIGREIRALECFAREPASSFRHALLVGRATGLTLEAPRMRDAFIEDGTGRGTIPLLADQSLRLAHVSRPSFEFAVSGYRVLYRWLAARHGEAIDAVLQRDIIDIANRIEELMHWFDAADAVLEHSLAAPLTRTQLGFGAARMATDSLLV